MDDDTQRDAVEKPTLRSSVDSFVSLAAVGAALTSIPSIVGARHWVLDNLTSAALHLLVALTVLALLAIGLRNHRMALLAAFTAALLSPRVYAHRDTGPVSDSPVLANWLVANVHTSNRNYSSLIALIRERSPDLIGLVETDSQWLRALDGPLRAYPHRVLEPREDNFGIALFSRVPLLDAQVRDFGIAPTVTATVELEGHAVDLVLVHVLPPISPDYAQLRDEQLARLGALRPHPGRGLVLAGDFNATPYSTTFAKSFAQPPFARSGGFAGTFPAQAHAALRIPIDHVLAAGTVLARKTLERDIGSDHMPMMIELKAK